MTRRLLVYGDSNTFGTGPMRTLDDDPIHPAGVRWGDVMAGELGDGWEVIVEGLPGRTTVHDDPVEGAHLNGLTVLPAILGSHRPIDLLAICLGTNDQKHRFGLTAQDVALGAARLVRAAMLTGWVGRVLVVTPPPVKERGDFREMFRGAETRCRGLSAEMARFGAREGAEVFDAGTVIETDEADGIHWSAASHDALGRAVAVVVRGLG